MNDETYLKSRTTYHLNNSTVWENRTIGDNDVFTGKLADLVVFVEGLVKEYGEDARVEYDPGWGDYGVGDYTVFVNRPMNKREAVSRAKSELAARIKRRKREEARQRRDRELYEHLKAKFEADDE